MRRWIGPILTGLGVLLIAAGFLAGGGTEPAAAGTSTTEPSTTTSTVADTTTTVAPVATTTTSPVETTTSTTEPPTTTTTVATETVEEFVEAFSAALESGDREFVGDRLHPVVYEGWGEDLCGAWIDREIMTLSDYTLVQVTSGPGDATVTTPNGSVSVANVSAADVTFSFQGQSFESVGSFASIDGIMYWLGQCR
jgi:hypothetical protein